MLPEATISSVAKCPRCGYDLRGAVATWKEACPLSGTCTECGLEFEWAEVLSEKVRKPRWCVEYAERWWHIPWRSVKTVAMTFWPWGFWSALRMCHPSRWKRLVAYLGLLLALGYLTFAVSHGLLVWGDWYDMAIDPSFTPTTSGWPVFLQAALLPFSDQSLGIMRFIGGGALYDSPLEVFGYFWLDFLPGLAMVLAMHTCCALTFAALPVSRRLCKVRWSHIVRMTVYGYALFLPAVLLTIITFGLRTIAGPAVDLMTALAWLTWLAFLPLEIIWWSVTTSRFLKMPHGWAVGVAVVVVGFLLPAVAWAIWLATSPMA